MEASPAPSLFTSTERPVGRGTEPLASVSFVVYGEAKPGGSKKAFPHPHTGRIIVTDDSGKKGKTWREDVRAAAMQAMGSRAPLSGALKVRLAFYRRRPKGHYRTGANAHLLRDSAPKYPVVRPDVLKLARAVEDALTNLAYVDDSQIVVEELSKCYGERDYLEVGIWELR